MKITYRDNAEKSQIQAEMIAKGYRLEEDAITLESNFMLFTKDPYEETPPKPPGSMTILRNEVATLKERVTALEKKEMVR